MTASNKAGTSTLLVHAGPVPADLLLAALRSRSPELAVRLWPDVGDPADIDYALVSRIAPGVLATLAKLRFVASLHAGVDHLLRDASLPQGLPIVRPVPTDGDALMNEYVLTQVLAHHRAMPAYAAQQRRAVWQRHEPRAAASRKVAMLGLGAMGLPVARLLRQTGFDVTGWTRRPRSDPSFPVLSGPQGLARLLSENEIFVNLLPLTPETAGLLNADAFARMPRGASIINVGRGEHVVDADLVAALDAGHLAGATLDVFRQEPLPADHPFWRHPLLTITPHACRRVSVDELAAQMVANIERSLADEALLGLVDRSAGY